MVSDAWRKTAVGLGHWCALGRSFRTRRSIHAHREDDTQLKVADWEWAGVGLPHADLGALVKSVRREDHAAPLQVFLEEDRRLEPEQHWRLFHWCQLERRLLDAAFLAKQQLISARRVSWPRSGVPRVTCSRQPNG
jgi:thiamine kinase-like enzyme